MFFPLSRKKSIGKAEPIKIIFTLIFSFLLRDIYCQTYFNDSFLTPFWPGNVSGDTSKFTRGNSRLTSNSTNLSKHSFGLQFLSNQSNAFELEATINCDINLSSSNFIDLGFRDSLQKTTFIRLGNTQDQFQLFLQDSLCFVGVEKEFNVSNIKLNFKMIVTNQNLKIIQLNLLDKTKKEYILPLNRAPLQCFQGFIQITQYGSSAIGKHSLTNIYLGPFRIDTIPPKIKSIKQIKNTTIEISFSEPIRKLKSYHLESNQIPIDSIFMNNDSTMLYLMLQNKLHQSFDSLDLFIKEITDLSGNKSINLNGICQYLYVDTPEYGDIILTEIMVKPYPTLGQLPEKKYIEIHNTTNQYFNANCLILTDQYSQCFLPNYIIKPKEYLAIGYKGDTSDFKFTNFLGVNSFPSFNQEEDYVILKTKRNKILFQTYYKENLMNIDHRNGGYSLEKIDVIHGTQECENWYTNSNIGGSPGKSNDQTAIYVPQKLKIIEAYHSADSIYIRVNKTLNPNAKFAAYCNGIEMKLSLKQNEILTGKLSLLLVNLPKLTIENILESDSLITTVGNIISSYKYSYNHTRIDFNEILFHNFSGNPDYIEFVNNDTSALFLDQFVLNIYHENGLGIKQQFPLKNTNRWLLMPSEYMCFTSEKSKILDQFPNSNKHLIIEKSGFPNFMSESGELGIIHLNARPTEVSQLNYNSKMHSEFYSETSGISLEKLNEILPSCEINSWNSATQTSNYGTPGIENSMKIHLTNFKLNNHFSIRKNTLNGNELLILDYSFNKPGYILNASIYNKNGFLLSNCIQNLRISNEGFVSILPYFHFQMLPPENYILKLEAFLPNADLCKQVIRFTVLNKN